MTEPDQTPPLVGSPTPRLATESRGLLTPATSKGFAVVDFARDVLKEPLLPWQETAAIRAMELNEDGTYRFSTVLIVVGRQNGKSHLLRTVALWRMLHDGTGHTLSTPFTVLGVAQNVRLAKEVWSAAVRMARREMPGLIDTVRKANGEVTLELTNTARWLIAASNEDAGRGFSVDHLIVDELRTFKGDSGQEAWNAINPTTGARPNSQTWLFSNAGDDESVVLNMLRDTAIAGGDPSLCLLEWSAEESADLDDRDAWAQANPALGSQYMSEKRLVSYRSTMTPDAFRTEHMCIRVTSLNAAIDLDAWKTCTDSSGSLDGLRDNVMLCLDVSPNLDHGVLVAAAATEDGLVRVEPVAEWTNMNVLREELADWLDRIKPRTFGVFPGPASALTADLQEIRTLTRFKESEVAAICMALAEQVTARRVLHPGDPMLSAQVAASKRLAVGDAWRFVRRGVGHVDAVYAAAGAVHLARTQPKRSFTLIVEPD